MASFPTLLMLMFLCVVPVSIAEHHTHLTSLKSKEHSYWKNFYDYILDNFLPNQPEINDSSQHQTTTSTDPQNRPPSNINLLTLKTPHTRSRISDKIDFRVESLVENEMSKAISLATNHEIFSSSPSESVSNPCKIANEQMRSDNPTWDAVYQDYENVVIPECLLKLAGAILPPGIDHFPPLNCPPPKSWKKSCKSAGGFSCDLSISAYFEGKPRKLIIRQCISSSSNCTTSPSDFDYIFKERVTEIQDWCQTKILQSSRCDRVDIGNHCWLASQVTRTAKIIGGVFGALMILATLLFLVYYLRRRRAQHHEEVLRRQLIRSAARRSYMLTKQQPSGPSPGLYQGGYWQQGGHIQSLA